MTAHSVFLCLVTALIAATFFESFLKVSRSTHRTIYWTCTAAAAACGFMVAYPNYKEGLLTIAFVVGGLVMTAYFNTPYIKIGGKIYALTVADSQPDPDVEDGQRELGGGDYDPAPDSYSGVLTPAKMWWGMVPLALMTGWSVWASSAGIQPWRYAFMGGGLLFVMASVGGLGDASWGYSVARRQYLAFVLVGILTGGVFTLVYLIGYYAGKRWPVRRKQSMEYRAHPRHQR